MQDLLFLFISLSLFHLSEKPILPSNTIKKRTEIDLAVVKVGEFQLKNFQIITNQNRRRALFRRLDSMVSKGFTTIYVREELDSKTRNISTTEKYFNEEKADTCFICYDLDSLSFYPNYKYTNGIKSYGDYNYAEYYSQKEFKEVLSDITNHFDTLELIDIAVPEIMGSVCNSCSWGWTQVDIQKEMRLLRTQFPTELSSELYRIEMLIRDGVLTNYQNLQGPSF